WHIECSVMSQKFLKTDTLDIHAGGRDLIFPHHENEIAQSEALTGKPFAKYWIHHGLLTINGQKMSKSLGNFITIKDFMDKYKNVNFLKLFFLSTHYSHPIDFTEEKIEEAKQVLERILILFDKINKMGIKVSKYQSIKEIDEVKDKFIRAMDDDFNSPEALACIFELVNLTNKNINNPDFVVSSKKTLKELLAILGISLTQPQAQQGLSEEAVEAKIEERNSARKAKNFALSDRIRKELEEKGIILEDTKDGKTSWRRKL
ncbi:MAG: class I tRNA ligase family protein, partial [Candidatus Omnitrophica bacterium]|nr:class I tRNA ligase family protein [Candidatus Omnitrophota bacterium]